MTNDEIDAAIGEKLGDFHHNFGEDQQCKDCYSFEHEDKFNHCPLKEAKNYTGDLNAVAQAVTSLTEEQKQAYAILLAGALWEPKDTRGWKDYRDTLAVSEATAHQRAEAFIKTVYPEKWKGNE
jgi:hypothetical protein